MITITGRPGRRARSCPAAAGPAAGHADVADQRRRARLAGLVQRVQHLARLGEAARGQVFARQRLSNTKRMEASSSTIQIGFMFLS